MLKKISVYLQYCLPQKALSYLFGLMSAIRWPWLKNVMIRYFIKHYAIDMNNLLEPHINQYETFKDFFIRRLKPEARPMVQDAKAIICPVDGQVTQMGTINQGILLQAKGMNYSLQELLGSDEKTALFYNGQFITLYLSPKDYHRIHMPIDGELESMTYVPGKLFSVNPTTCQGIPEIFAKNERVINIFKTQIGAMAVILIGALNVGSLHTAWAGQVSTYKEKNSRKVTYEAKKVELLRGNELGYFSLGSTVIILFEPNKMKWINNLVQNNKVLMGEQIGEIL